MEYGYNEGDKTQESVVPPPLPLRIRPQGGGIKKILSDSESTYQIK